jgi:hypothetical protein
MILELSCRFEWFATPTGHLVHFLMPGRLGRSCADRRPTRPNEATVHIDRGAGRLWRALPTGRFWIRCCSLLQCGSCFRRAKAQPRNNRDGFCSFFNLQFAICNLKFFFVPRMGFAIRRGAFGAGCSAAARPLPSARVNNNDDGRGSGRHRRIDLRGELSRMSPYALGTGGAALPGRPRVDPARGEREAPPSFVVRSRTRDPGTLATRPRRAGKRSISPCVLITWPSPMFLKHGPDGSGAAATAAKRRAFLSTGSTGVGLVFLGGTGFGPVFLGGTGFQPVFLGGTGFQPVSLLPLPSTRGARTVAAPSSAVFPAEAAGAPACPRSLDRHPSGSPRGRGYRRSGWTCVLERAVVSAGGLVARGATRAFQNPMRAFASDAAARPFYVTSRPPLRIQRLPGVWPCPGRPGPIGLRQEGIAL